MIVALGALFVYAMGYMDISVGAQMLLPYFSDLTV